MEPTADQRESDDVERLFRAGDFHEARRRAAALLARADARDAARDRARAVLAGVRADPWALAALAACAALLVVVMWLTLR